MTDPLRIHHRLDRLKVILADGEQELRDRKREMASARRARRRTYWWCVYLWAATKTRYFKPRYELWPLAVQILLPLALAVFTLVLLSLFHTPWWVLLPATLLAGGGGWGLAHRLLYSPTDEALPDAVAIARSKLDVQTQDLAILKREFAERHRQLVALQEERDELRLSITYQREQLLQSDWRSLRDRQWEIFVQKVFRLLGYDVDRTGRSGDQGVDLVVHTSTKRIAIQAKGYRGSVSNSAVQQAVAGQAMYRCTDCAVITNSHFTQSAIELAKQNRCTLIDEDKMPDLVLGEIDW